MIKFILRNTIIFTTFFCPTLSWAGERLNLSEATTKLTGVVGSLSSLALAIAFICGLGFVISSMMKFKKHKDNPQQMPLSTPVTELCLGVALLFIPAISKIAGYSVFGHDAIVSSRTGEQIPIHQIDTAPSFNQAPKRAPQKQYDEPESSPQQAPQPAPNQNNFLKDYGIDN